MSSQVLVQHWPALLTVYTACLVAFTSPGPNFVAISSRAVEDRTAGIGAALGISVGTALWALFAATGITAVLSAQAGAARVVGVVGGAYLCWLGVKSLRSARAAPNLAATAVAGHSLLQSARTGLFIQLTNPKTALFWLALTSVAIKPHTPPGVIGLLVLGCLAIAIAWHVLLALVLSTGPSRAAYLRAKPVISVLFGLLFIGFGGRILLDAVLGA